MRSATRSARRSAARVPASATRFQRVSFRPRGRVSGPQLLSRPQKRNSTGTWGQARLAATVQNGQKLANARRGGENLRNCRARIHGMHHVWSRQSSGSGLTLRLNDALPSGLAGELG
jgi:hypothetical protein